MSRRFFAVLEIFVVALGLNGCGSPGPSGGEALPGEAPPNETCVQSAILILKDHSPTGYKSYTRAKDKKEFSDHLGACNDPDFYTNLASAVHEINHTLRSENQAYHLVSDEMLPVPAAAGYFPPEEMANDLATQLGQRDSYFSIYMGPGGVSSKDDFTYLLDEFNAYSNELQVLVELNTVAPLKDRQIGVLAFMSFLGFYANYARIHHPETWADLLANKAMNSALIKLWTQAEISVGQACQMASIPPVDDSFYVRYLCDPSQVEAISTILGRPSVCPRACH